MGLLEFRRRLDKIQKQKIFRKKEKQKPQSLDFISFTQESQEKQIHQSLQQLQQNRQSGFTLNNSHLNANSQSIDSIVGLRTKKYSDLLGQLYLRKQKLLDKYNDHDKLNKEQNSKAHKNNIKIKIQNVVEKQTQIEQKQDSTLLMQYKIRIIMYKQMIKINAWMNTQSKEDNIQNQILIKVIQLKKDKFINS
ncbi:hypothetical protein PPERSA_08082 [Pseudocohnilembus persalinus]|uniref:Uncharacterized protein n=1 Tax=Pseudocohnilembus persalinus TaxID=266149 RepID=A0A0V0R2N3_PSEPJ|nr:hypothetical protein PPERSA_08082 [Pseudocohnilembus persalinus]|eukprot:KRX08771.1 hypothetical protein PPERSA_08082 [Pseudocohnilembus persalinus]